MAHFVLAVSVKRKESAVPPLELRKNNVRTNPAFNYVSTRLAIEVA